MSDELPVSVHAAGGSEADATGHEPAMPAFYLDLASPECYLTAERILTIMPVPVEWVPVHLSPPPPTEAERDEIAAKALARRLQPVRWPPPFDAELVNLTATYAKSIGRTVAFALAALRQAYAGGRDLSVSDNVVIAASACEMHPTAVLKSVGTRGVRETLATATATARERGVISTPAIWIPPDGGVPAQPGCVLHGDARLEDAAALLAAQLG
jgi:2-hydroxychromene-2-carboxylate isomerase